MKLNKYSRLQIRMLITLFCIGLHSQAQNVKELLILHTNDTHSRIDPLPITPDFPERSNKAGYVRRATLVRNLRAQHPDLLLFDCGDFSQGTPYYNMFQGEVEVKLMSEMGYDAGAIGNHEFDFGIENMKRIFTQASYPIVCANYDFNGTVLEGIVKPYVILKRNGLKIGVFGLSPRMEGLVSGSNFKGVTYKDPVKCANEVAEHLKIKEHCDVVICLSHMGWKAGVNNPECDEYIIERTRHIDVILGGHSHSYFKEPIYYRNVDGDQVILQQMGKNGQFVGTLKLTFTKDKQ